MRQIYIYFSFFLRKIFFRCFTSICSLQSSQFSLTYYTLVGSAFKKCHDLKRVCVCVCILTMAKFPILGCTRQNIKLFQSVVCWVRLDYVWYSFGRQIEKRASVYLDDSKFDRQFVRLTTRFNKLEPKKVIPVLIFNNSKLNFFFNCLLIKIFIIISFYIFAS